MPDVKLNVSQAAELAEMLQFLESWLAQDPARIGASLEWFISDPTYGARELCSDLEGFVLLLGGSDGEPVSGLSHMTRTTS